MTHFLARLVERTRGTAPRVEPIIAPRFAVAAPLTEIASEIEAAPPANPGAREKETTAPKRRPPAEDVQPEATAKTNENLLDETMETTQSLLVPLPQPAEEIAPRLAWTRGSESFRRDVLPHVQSVDGAPFVRPTNHLPRSAQTRPSNRPALAAEVLSLPNEPPIVHVTIGRIEVRATPVASPRPRKPSRSAPPKLTLDAYLKERREGAR